MYTTEHLSQHMTSQRLEIIDALRGMAICGIIFMNIPFLLDIPFQMPQADRYLLSRFEMIFRTKFYVILSFLFGVSAFIFVDHLRQKNLNPFLLFFRRLVFLFVVGVIHSFLHPGEALTVYAIIGLVLIPAFLIKPEWNFFVACCAIILCIFFIPTYISVLGLFYLGYYIGQIRFFYSTQNYTKTLVWVLMISFIMALWGFYLLSEFKDTSYYFKILTLSGIMQAFTYMSMIILLYNSIPLAKIVLRMLAPVGRLALTNYILQTIIILLIGDAFGLKAKIYYTNAIYIATGIIIFQVAISNLWLHLFSYVPLEWVWRKWTYSFTL